MPSGCLFAAAAFSAGLCIGLHGPHCITHLEKRPSGTPSLRSIAAHRKTANREMQSTLFPAYTAPWDHQTREMLMAASGHCIMGLDGPITTSSNSAVT
jgi:hypothetical protein